MTDKEKKRVKIETTLMTDTDPVAVDILFRLIDKVNRLKERVARLEKKVYHE